MEGVNLALTFWHKLLKYGTLWDVCFAPNFLFVTFSENVYIDCVIIERKWPNFTFFVRGDWQFSYTKHQ